MYQQQLFTGSKRGMFPDKVFKFWSDKGITDSNQAFRAFWMVIAWFMPKAGIRCKDDSVSHDIADAVSKEGTAWVKNVLPIINAYW